MVVYFAGQVGKGKVDWEDLPNADLWNGIGCGGSQKCEIAYLDRQKWPYVETDAINFLRQEFQWGKDVVAWEGQEWTRGTIVQPPHLSPHSESSVEQTAQCIVRCSKTGRTFATHRVRHGDRIQQLLEAVGEHEFLAMVANLLPEGVEVVGSGAQTPILQDGEVSWWGDRNVVEYCSILFFFFFFKTLRWPLTHFSRNWFWRSSVWEHRLKKPQSRLPLWWKWRSRRYMECRSFAIISWMSILSWSSIASCLKADMVGVNFA